MLKFTKKLIWLFVGFIGVFLLGACSSGNSVSTSAPTEAASTLQPTDIETVASPVPPETSAPIPTETKILQATNTPTEVVSDRLFADVVSVTVSGSENVYTFAVEIRSPDTGCEQYANWWEVVTEDGELVYRRILGHSHVSEQPFTRSGGPVQIGPDEIVIVRAHMHPTGYGGTAFRGSVSGGFETIQLDADFASELESADPLPDGCAF